MWFQNKEFPGLLVEDGETITITSDTPELSALALRPLTTAAVLVTCGVYSPSPARLSDPDAFEKLDATEGYVNVGQPSRDGRIGGYTSPFLRHVVAAFDPERPVPASVRWHTPVQSADVPEDEDIARSAVRMPVRNIGIQPRYIDVEMPVPQFLTHFKIFTTVPFLSDIVVGYNATLVIDQSIHQLSANNILCYGGSRIRQEGAYLAVDAQGIVAGGISRTIHNVAGSSLVILSDVLNNLPHVMN